MVVCLCGNHPQRETFEISWQINIAELPKHIQVVVGATKEIKHVAVVRAVSHSLLPIFFTGWVAVIHFGNQFPTLYSMLPYSSYLLEVCKVIIYEYPIHPDVMWPLLDMMLMLTNGLNVPYVKY